MTVTITINDNGSYCREHNLERIHRVECHCVGELPGCPICSGQGCFEYADLPYELNLANANFATLWSSLGFDATEYGEMAPSDLLLALHCGSPELACRAERLEQIGDGPVLLELGIAREQADRYHHVLREIAEEAAERDEPIIWG